MPTQAPKPLPIALAVHGRAPTVSLVHALESLDPAAQEAHWVTTLHGLHDLVLAEKARTKHTIWKTEDQIITNVVDAWAKECRLYVPAAKRHRRTEAELRDQAGDLVVRSEALGLLRQLENRYRTPDQRMFDALERHNHDALRRALAAGASVEARFVPDKYDDGRRHAWAHGFKEAAHMTGQKPIVWAVMEDDVIALRMLLAAGASKREAVCALYAVEKQGNERERVHWVLDSEEVHEAAEEAGRDAGRDAGERGRRRL